MKCYVLIDPPYLINHPQNLRFTYIGYDGSKVVISQSLNTLGIPYIFSSCKLGSLELILVLGSNCYRDLLKIIVLFVNTYHTEKIMNGHLPRVFVSVPLKYTTES